MLSNNQISCRICRPPIFVTLGRLVEPFSWMAKQFKEIMHEPKLPNDEEEQESPTFNQRSRSPQSRQSFGFDATSPDVSPRSKSTDGSLLLTESAHRQPPLVFETQTSTSAKGLRKVTSFLYLKPKTHTPPMPPISYSLSSDGKFLVAWTSKEACCYDIEMRTWSIKYCAQNVLLAAGCRGNSAVVSGSQKVNSFWPFTTSFTDVAS